MDIHRFSKYLVYTLILTIPLTHKELFSIYMPDLVWSKFILAIIAIIGAFYFLTDYRRYLKDKFFLLLLLIVGFQLLSLLQSKDIQSSVEYILFQLAVIFSYPVFKSFIQYKKGSINDLINIYALVLSIIIIFLGFQMYLQENFKIAIGGIWPVPEYPTRYGSTFWDVNHFGAYLSSMMFLFLAIIFVYAKKIFKNRIILVLYAICFVASLVALYFTSSRSAMIGFIIGLFFFSFGVYKSKVSISRKDLPQWLIYLSGVCLTLVPISFLYFYSDQIRQAFLYRGVSFFSHLFLLKVGIQVGLSHFLLGIGVNSFYSYFKETQWADAYYYIDAAALNLKLPLHNLWLEVLAETGIVSFLVFTSFWILLLITLYKQFIKQKDYIALGLMSGLISFLVGGFMYSYKGEFFWVYALIATAYASYHQPNLKILLKEHFDLKALSVGIISFVSLIIPIIFITVPILPKEADLFYGAYKSNILTDTYLYILNLFRYVLGNYVYTGRLVSLLFYFSSIILLWNILNRYFRKIVSLVLVALIFNILGVFFPIIQVSIIPFIVFGVLVIVGFFLAILSLVRFTPDKIFLGTSTIMALQMLVVVFALTSTYFTNQSFKTSYDKDLVFLNELAHNRKLFSKSAIWIDGTVDQNLVYYYCDEVKKDGNKFVNNECVINGLQDISVFNGDPIGKNLIIGYNSIVSDFEKSLVESKTKHITRINSGKYSLLVVE